MTILHVREQGAVVRRDMEMIRVTGKRQGEEASVQVLAETPVRELEQVALYGNVQLTTQAATLLMEQGVDVVFLSRRGKVRGRLDGGGGMKYAHLRHEQMKMSTDPKRGLEIARAIVGAKLTNQRNTLHIFAQQKTDREESLTRFAGQIEEMRKRTLGAASPELLLGFEGQAGRAYFGGMQLLLDDSWAFRGRNYYPPQDPFNALLSFGYALLLKDITAAVHLAGLDPYLGCLHALDYGRPSLVLDLMEEFRPLAVDRPMLEMAVRGQVRPGEFVFHKDKAERPVELGDRLIQQVIEVYEAGVEGTWAYGAEGRQESLRRIFGLQAYLFRSLALGQRRDYVGMQG